MPTARLCGTAVASHTECLRAECEMQQSLLQQAEAIWQVQHDRLSAELAQMQQSSQNALAEVEAQHRTALEALQVRQCTTRCS